jgi:hypothetical protein
MPGELLTTQSTIQCPHGGQASLKSANSKIQADSAAVMLETDVHDVNGCSFTIGTKYSPCKKIEWKAGAGSVQVNGTAALLKSSVGLCKNGEGAPQGTAIIMNTQMKVSGK